MHLFQTALPVLPGAHQSRQLLPPPPPTNTLLQFGCLAWIPSLCCCADAGDAASGSATAAKKLDEYDYDNDDGDSSDSSTVAMELVGYANEDASDSVLTAAVDGYDNDDYMIIWLHLF